MIDAQTLLVDLGMALKVEMPGLTVRSMRLALSGTQTAAVEVPTSVLPKGRGTRPF